MCKKIIFPLINIHHEEWGQPERQAKTPVILPPGDKWYD
jgi:hypothetical protein